MTTQLDEREGLPSASSFERLVFCAGSPAAEALFPGDNEEAEIAKRGVLIHEALETDNDEELKVSDKIVKDKIRAIEEEALTAWLEEHGIPRNEVTILREQRVWIRDRVKLTKIASARVDFAAVAEKQGMALVVDAKTGFLDTTAAEANWQLRVQAVAVWHEYNFGVNHVVAAIAAGRGKAKFDPVAYGPIDLEWAERQIQFYARNAADPHAPRVPGLHCRYCKARGRGCPESTVFALTPMGSAVGDNQLTRLTPKFRKQAIAERVQAMSIEQLAFVHSRANIANAIFDQTKDRLKTFLKDELAAVGLELVPNASMRKITDIQSAFFALSGRKLVTDEEFRGMCKLSVGEVEELLAPRVKAMMIAQGGECRTLEDAKKQLNTLLEKAITMVPKSPSLKSIK
jgi:hypothetical protein